MSNLKQKYLVTATIEVEVGIDQEKQLGDLYNDIGLMFVECGWEIGSSLSLTRIATDDVP